MILVKNKVVEDDESSIPSNKYQIKIVDSSGNPLSGAEVTYNSQKANTGSDGKVLLNLVSVGIPVIKVVKQGYISWTNENSNYEKQESRNETIILYKEEEGKLKLKSAYYKNGNLLPAVNLLSTTKTLNLKNTGDMIGNLTNGKFSIVCEAMDVAKVQEYQLWQKDKKIAISEDGTFELDVEQGFASGGNCFIRVITAEGEKVDTYINLTFVSNSVNKGTGISLMDNLLGIQVKDDVPYIGGSKLNIGISKKIPVDFKVTTEKVYVGFNAQIHDSSDDGTSPLEKIQKSIDAAKKAGNTPLGWKTEEEVKKLIKEPNEFNLPSGKFQVDIIGYAEGNVGSKTAKGELYICISGTSPTAGFNTWVAVVPVTVQVKGTVKAEFGGEVSYDWTTGVLDGGLQLNIKVALDAFGGIGIGKAVGVGAYGNAEAEIDSRILGVNAGVQSVDLTGELGLKIYFANFSYQRTFAHNTWHIYTKNAVSASSLNNSTVQNSTSGLYNAKNYTMESLEYMREESEWNGTGVMLSDVAANTSFSSLIENTYRNAQPVMATDGSAIYAAFLRADADTGAIYAAYTKMQDGMWSTPVRVDEAAVLDEAPQITVDENGNVWIAYAQTGADTDTTSLLSYAQNQSIVIGTIDPETLEFTEVKEYDSNGYAHMQQLAIVNGTPMLTWIESTVTDDNSVLSSKENKVLIAKYEHGAWSTAETLCNIAHPVLQLALGDAGVACCVDVDDTLDTVEDVTLVCYDLLGTETTSVAGVTGNISYGILPGETEASFVWNEEDKLCSIDNSIEVVGITNEYCIIGNKVYYSTSDENGAELAVVIRNSDGTFSEPIILTNTERYLENLSVETINGMDIVLGMHTAVEIKEEEVIPEKNLVWSIVQPVNDIQIDGVDYDTTIVTPGESVPITLTVTNSGEQEVTSVTVSVNETIVATENVALANGKSADISFNVACPEALTEYEIQITDTASDLTSDYTPDNNSTSIKLGYTDISVNTQLQQIGNKRIILAEVTNVGTETVAGTITVYDETGQLLGLNTFSKLEKDGMLLLEIPLFESVVGTTVTVSAATEQEELYLYNNSAILYLNGLDDAKEDDDEKNDEEPVVYTIAYELNGGVQNAENPQTYLNTDADILFADPSRKGYQFEGWYSDSSYKTRITEIATGSVGNMTLYAKWSSNKYAVVFDGNGATNGSMSSLTNCEYEKQYILSKNAFEKKGYTFTAWNTNADGNGTTIKDGASITSLTDVNEETITLYAQWTKVKYTIIYKLDGGTNDSKNPTSYYITSSTILLKNPNKEGYTFEGWYSDSKYKNRITQISKGSIGKLTLYAKWSANKYIIKFNGNGATSGSMKNLTSRQYGTSYTLTANAFKKKGYVFKGWNTKADGSGKSYKDKASVKNLTTVNGKTVTLYAQWTKAKYTITYKLNGGTNNSKNPSSYYITSSTITLKNPTRKGYTFKGWYSDSKYKNKITQISKGSTGKITLYAKWSENKYTVKFNGNGATSGSMKNLTSRQYGTSYTLTANAFKKKGYVFKGWNTKADGSGKLYKDKTSVKNLTTVNGKTVTLYAQWTKAKYTITYKLNGGTNNSKNPSGYYITSSTITLKNPTRKGYIFKGWYSDSKYKKRITQISKESTGKITLYAKWKKK